MLQQILRDMYIDPEILEELSDDQKQILFFKMREEQIRRWKLSEDKLLAEEKVKPRIIKKSTKNVNFYCDGDSNLIIDYIKEPDGIDLDDLKKKQEEEALKKAEEQARKEAAQKRKELDEIEKKQREELRLKEEIERLKKEKEEKEEEVRRKAEEEAIYQSLEAARLQKEKEEAENILFEEKKQKEEEQRRKQEEQRRKQEEQRRKQEEQWKREEEIRLREEVEKKKREEELAEEERVRKEEIYQSMKKEQEERRERDEEESKRLEDEWKEREIKAKEAEQQRRNSFSYSKGEFERMRKLAKEKSELEKMRKPDIISEFPNIETMPNESPSSIPESTTPAAGSVSTPLVTKSAATPSLPSTSKSRTLPAKRPPLPSRPDSLLRPTISTPVQVTSTRDQVDTIPVQKEIIKPSRPPPPPSKGSPNLLRGTIEKNDAAKPKRNNKPTRPPRPKSKIEVLTWWKEVEYGRLSGLDENKKPMEWFHGVITRHEAEKLLGNKKQGSYLVRVSERVWGYTISFKDIGRCKHFLIDTIHGGYQFFGMEQIVHNSLNELVEYHKRNPISGLGQEILLYPCGQEKSRPDYEHLFVDNTLI